MGEAEMVLFDLGGVLVEVLGVRPMLELTGMGDEEELWQRWLGCRWVRAFESGTCSEREFADGLVSEWGLTISPVEFLARFANWPTGPLIGAEKLVAQTRTAVPVGCLSNTNALHWYGRFGTWPLLDLFDHRFLSFEMGLLKPDLEAFEQVTMMLGVPAERILFIDDNSINVEGAKRAGCRALRAVGVAEARQHLVDAGVLGPEGVIVAERPDS